MLGSGHYRKSPCLASSLIQLKLLALKRREDANVLVNSHTRGNLHRTRNQRLPAGRVLTTTSVI
jgi:hypothetical protein